MAQDEGALKLVGSSIRKSPCRWDWLTALAIEIGVVVSAGTVSTSQTAGDKNLDIDDRSVNADKQFLAHYPICEACQWPQSRPNLKWADELQLSMTPENSST
jgi:hypothetical protein